MVFRDEATSFMNFFITFTTKIDFIIDTEQSCDFSTSFIVTIRNFQICFLSFIKIKIDQILRMDLWTVIHDVIILVDRIFLVILIFEMHTIESCV